MGRYYVKMPFTGYVGLEVTADNEEAAKEAFHDAWGNPEISGLTDPSIEMEWEFTEKVVGGNVCYATLNEVDVEPIDEEE